MVSGFPPVPSAPYTGCPERGVALRSTVMLFVADE